MALSKDGSTPLHSAASKGHPQIILTLLAVGADPKARTIEGYTPWQLAKKNKRVRDTRIYWVLNEAQYDSLRGTSPAVLEMLQLNIDINKLVLERRLSAATTEIDKNRDALNDYENALLGAAQTIAELRVEAEEQQLERVARFAK